MNALMHRDYQGNAPVKFYQYRDRLEIVNHGGLYGRARPENFPNVSDYRNPVVAEAMRVLGYVNRYNRGIATLQRELAANGNGPARFSFRLLTAFEAVVSLSHPLVGVAPKTEPVAVKNEPVAVKNEPVAVKTEPVAVKINFDLADKSIRIAVSTMLTTRQSTVREAVVEKCMRVYKALRDNDAATGRELATKLEYSPRTTERCLAILRHARLIAHVGPANGGKWTFPK